jgi:hypothetical protein
MRRAGAASLIVVPLTSVTKISACAIRLVNAHKTNTQQRGMARGMG